MEKSDFDKLRIGDEVLGVQSRKLTVKDINRKTGKIQTGGQWRSYKDVALPGASARINPTNIPPLDEFTVFRTRMLLDFGFSKSVIMKTIHDAGASGLVASSEQLAIRIGLVSTHLLRSLVPQMIAAGLITRQKIAGCTYRFRLAAEVEEKYYST